jgi:hypothetical protein
MLGRPIIGQEEYWVQWNWLRRYCEDMLRAVEKTREDCKERGFFMIQHADGTTARTRRQTGTTTRVVLQMKDLAVTTGDMLISFHTHVCSGHDYPSTIDKRTAIALGEDYTVIGYVDDAYPKYWTEIEKTAQPHIKIWRIWEKMNKHVGARYRFIV